jgi:hypothetical protein
MASRLRYREITPNGTNKTVGDMKGQLPIEIISAQHVEAEKDLPDMLDALADALADQFIAKARQEVAKKLGIKEEKLHQEPARINLDETMRTLQQTGARKKL